jgi:hypothetical protein
MNQPFELIEIIELIEPLEHSPSNQNHQTFYHSELKIQYF